MNPVLTSTSKARAPRAGSATDEALVAAVRAGSDAAFSAIVRRYEPQLMAYARQVLGGRHHDAEECVQDAFVRALRSITHGDAEIALRPWLHAIVRNRCLDQLRKPNRTTDLDPHEAFLADHGPGPVSTIARRERLDEVVGGVEALPERQRRALVMHELEDRSHSHIGRVLGVSAGASKALVCRARAGVAQAVGRAAA
ncbi:MAG TPA: sigma-70 family RNA polymerase sigma factor [Baekduia sp.]|uniref:RNA polymerase sigma factor n=1 Tax=Baekduia sp. TaxID=2600305 RepID=UPI002C65393C|nr:sigma-70 family RNA polymerase sigma factor [Baekduia sp.]HMJ33280.1 sigma-70 family RNA polymerase sigma factor [Baekduia sp.]